MTLKIPSAVMLFFAVAACSGMQAPSGGELSSEQALVSGAPVLSSPRGFTGVHTSGSYFSVWITADVAEAAGGAQVVMTSTPAGAILTTAYELGSPPSPIVPLAMPSFAIPSGQTLIHVETLFGEVTGPTAASLCFTVTNDVGGQSSSHCFDATVDRRFGIVSISGDVTNITDHNGIHNGGTLDFGPMIAPGAEVMRTITFTNTGGNPPLPTAVNLTAEGLVAVYPPFTIWASTCGAVFANTLTFSLAPGGSCSTTVRFSSNTLGGTVGSLGAYGQYVNPIAVTLSGYVCNTCGGVCRPPPSSVTATRARTCSSSTLTAWGTPSGGFGARFRWYTGSCGGTAAGSGASITVAPAQTTTYYVRAEGGLCGPSTCTAFTVSKTVCGGNCSSCDAAAGTCQANPSACTGNCDQCTGAGDAFSCSANAALCSGTCAVCTGSGTSFSCGANELSCPGTCSACSGSGASFSCAPAGCRPGSCRTCGSGRIQLCTNGCSWGTCTIGHCP